MLKHLFFSDSLWWMNFSQVTSRSISCCSCRVLSSFTLAWEGTCGLNLWPHLKSITLSDSLIMCWDLWSRVRNGSLLMQRKKGCLWIWHPYMRWKGQNWKYRNRRKPFRPSSPADKEIRAVLLPVPPSPN